MCQKKQVRVNTRIILINLSGYDLSSCYPGVNRDYVEASSPSNASGPQELLSRCEPGLR